MQILTTVACMSEKWPGHCIFIFFKCNNYESTVMHTTVISRHCLLRCANCTDSTVLPSLCLLFVIAYTPHFVTTVVKGCKSGFSFGFELRASMNSQHCSGFSYI